MTFILIPYLYLHSSFLYFPSVGHLFLSTPDGTPQIVLDGSHFNLPSANFENVQDKSNAQQVTNAIYQTGYFFIN